VIDDCPGRSCGWKWERWRNFVRGVFDQLANGDLIVLDIRLPDCDGIDFIDGFQASRFPLLLLLSGSGEEFHRPIGQPQARPKVLCTRTKNPRSFDHAIPAVGRGTHSTARRFIARDRQLDQDPQAFSDSFSARAE